MAEIMLNNTISRPKSGATISYSLLLKGDTLTVSKAYTDAFGCKDIGPFTLRRQEVSQVRLRLRLLLNSHELFVLFLCACSPLILLLYIHLIHDPSAYILLCDPYMQLLFLFFFFLMSTIILIAKLSWGIRFTCRDGSSYNLPLTGYPLFPFRSHEREPLIRFIREIKTWESDF